LTVCFDAQRAVVRLKAPQESRSPGQQLVTDCNIELNQGCRYGLLGDNGSGKSNVLAAIAQREVPPTPELALRNIRGVEVSHGEELVIVDSKEFEAIVDSLN